MGARFQSVVHTTSSQTCEADLTRCYAHYLACFALPKTPEPALVHKERNQNNDGNGDAQDEQ